MLCFTVAHISESVFKSVTIPVLGIDNKNVIGKEKLWNKEVSSEHEKIRDMLSYTATLIELYGRSGF